VTSDCVTGFSRQDERLRKPSAPSVGHAWARSVSLRLRDMLRRKASDLCKREAGYTAGTCGVNGRYMAAWARRGPGQWVTDIWRTGLGEVPAVRVTATFPRAGAGPCQSGGRVQARLHVGLRGSPCTPATRLRKLAGMTRPSAGPGRGRSRCTSRIPVVYPGGPAALTAHEWHPCRDNPESSALLATGQRDAHGTPSMRSMLNYGISAVDGAYYSIASAESKVRNQPTGSRKRMSSCTR
jgi:hypothetical protein